MNLRELIKDGNIKHITHLFKINPDYHLASPDGIYIYGHFFKVEF